MEIIKSYEERYRQYLQYLGYSKSSCYMLPELVKDFLRHAAEPIITNITTVHIQSFYEWLQIRPHKQKGGGLSEAYIAHHIFALKTFFNWLETIGEVKYNPISVMKFKSPKGNKREPLSQEEIKQLFEATETEKEKAILHLFYSCGLRRSEAEALNIKDLHFKQQLLYVREGKGAKRRAVPMTEKVTKDLESYWLQERTKGKEDNAFMLNKKGRRMRGDSYSKVVRELKEKAGIQREVTPHYLRHSIATHLLESGLSVEYVRDFLGHSFLESTQIYVKVNQSQLRKL